MAISIVDRGAVNVSAGSTSITVNFGATTQAGDILITGIRFAGNYGAGYTISTSIPDKIDISVSSATGLIRTSSVILGTAYSSYQITTSVSSAIVLTYVIVRGAAPLINFAFGTPNHTYAAGTSTAPSTPGITRVGASNYTVITGFLIAPVSATLTPPGTAGLIASTLSPTATIPGASICSELGLNTIPSGTRTASLSASAAWQAYTYILSPDDEPVLVQPNSAKNLTGVNINTTGTSSGRMNFAGNKALAYLITSSAPTGLTISNNGGTNPTWTLLTSVNLNNSAANGTLYVYETNVTTSVGFLASATSANLMACLVTVLPVLSSRTAILATPTGGSSTAPTVTLSGLTSAITYDFIGVGGEGGPTTDTATQPAGWTRSSMLMYGTTGGGAATNRSIFGGYERLSGQTSETYNPTLGTSRNWGLTLIAYQRGNIFTDTITESVTATDSQIGIEGDEKVNESVTATDSQIGTNLASSSITETATATETETAANLTSSSITESVTTTDSETATQTQNSTITEIATATETEDAANTLGAVITETATATETETATNTANAYELESNATLGSIMDGAAQTLINSSGQNIDSTLAVGNTFIAPQTGQLGNIKFNMGILFNSSPPTTQGAIELWQLASNSLSATPSTLLASLSVPFVIPPANSSGATLEYDLSSVSGMSVTSGVGYAIVVAGGSDWGSSTSTWRIFRRTLRSPYAYIRRISGVWEAASLTQIFGIELSYLNNTLDTQIGGINITSAITETATATETEDATYSPTSDITETATATDTETATNLATASITETATATETETAANLTSSSITETGTATDAETAVDQANAWLTENTVSNSGGFTNVLALGISSLGNYLNYTASSASLGIRFIASQTKKAGVVTVNLKRTGATTPAQPIRLTLWQLASNSLTALPSINLGEILVNWIDLPTVTSYTTYDFSSLNITLTSGVGYALTVTTPSDLASTGSQVNYGYVDASTTARRSASNYYKSVYSNIGGTYPSSYTASTLLFTFDLQPVQNTADTQIGGINLTSTITETATATETEEAANTTTSTITETATATETEDAANTLGAVITETATATETETAGFDANALITETATATETEDATQTQNSTITETATATDSEIAEAPQTAAITETATATDTETAVYTTIAFISNSISNPNGDYLQNLAAAAPNLYGQSVFPSSGNASIGTRFIANTTGQVGNIVFRTFRSGVTPTTQPARLTLWQLASNSITAFPSVNLGEITFDLSTIGTSVIGNLNYAFDFSSLNITLTAGTGYAVTLTNPSDTTSGTYNLATYAAYGSNFSAETYFKNIYRGFTGTYPSTWSNSDSSPYAFEVLGLPATNTQTAGFDANALITETATATETEDAANTLGANITETGTATDTEDATYSPTSDITETATATETESAQADFVSSITETGTATDAETAGFAANALITETVTATETETATYSPTSDITETVTATTNQSALTIFTASILESITASDEIIAILIYGAAITESVTATDSARTIGWYNIPDGQIPDWNPINDTQSGTWVAVSDGQTANWNTVNDVQVGTWTAINDGQSPNWVIINDNQ
jgi:hypothetical protein